VETFYSFSGISGLALLKIDIIVCCFIETPGCVLLC